MKKRSFTTIVYFYNHSVFVEVKQDEKLITEIQCDYIDVADKIDRIDCYIDSVCIAYVYYNKDNLKVIHKEIQE